MPESDENSILAFYRKYLRPFLPVLIAVAAAIAVMFFLKAVFNGLGGIIDLKHAASAGHSILVISVIAFVTMSLIQATRNLFPVRAWFHEEQLRRSCLQAEQALLKAQPSTLIPPPTPEEALSEVRERVNADIAGLLSLANAPDRDAFFNAPLEQICGQLIAVGEFLMSGGSWEQDPDQPPLANGQKMTAAHLLAILTGASNARNITLMPWFAGDHKQLSLTMEDRKQLGYHVQRHIDQLQIAIASRWQQRLRFTAMVLSTIIALGDFQTNWGWGAFCPANLGTSFHHLILAVLLGLVAGYLATVMRDLVALLERLRGA